MLEPSDRNAGFRMRRARARRRRRLRRALTALALALVLAVAGAFALRQQESPDAAEPAAAAPEAPPAPEPAGAAAPTSAPAARVEPPEIVRGVHVTMRLAATPGRLDAYLALPGLNAIEVDVKDEGGLVGFVPASVPLAREIGAAQQYYNPWRLAERVHGRGIYLIGRVVAFQDDRLAAARPELAVRRGDGSLWRTDGGRAWLDPYDRRAWAYVVDVAAAAARAGFDELQFDYVRFPSDGNLGDVVFPGRTERPPEEVVAAFLRYAGQRLRPLGVRVSAAVFGLSATLDVGVGQSPRLLAPHVDAISPMAYPSHYRPGEYGLADPNAAPGPTVAATMRDFRRELEGSSAAVVPWLQDFSLGRRYGLEDVRAQIDAALNGGARGFLLWNPHGEYTPGALVP